MLYHCESCGDKVTREAKEGGCPHYILLADVRSRAHTAHYEHRLHFQLRTDYLCIHFCASPTMKQTYRAVLY